MALIPLVEKEQADDSLQPIYERFEQDAGSVPAWVKVMANAPAVTASFVPLFRSVMGPGSVEPILKWKIGYLVSETLKCEFCVSATRQMLMKLGADEDMMERVKDLRCDSETERDILEVTRDITEDGSVERHDALERLRGKLSPEELTEIASVIGFFNYINRFNNFLAVEPA